MPTLTPTGEDTRIYEFCVLFPYPMTQKEEQEAVKEVEGIFAEAGGTQVAKDNWGRRGLAYSVKGSTEGVFIVYHYELDPSKLKEIDEALRIQRGVLRHLIVKPPKHYQVVKYSEAFEQWLKDRETQEEVKAREREEKVKEQVARRAKRQAKVTAERKKAETPSAGAEDLTQKIDELISGDAIDNL